MDANILWKSVENFRGPGAGGADYVRTFTHSAGGTAGRQAPLTACSACAGNYEDPERTAWAPPPDEDDTENETSPQWDAGERHNTDAKVSVQSAAENEPHPGTEEQP